MVQVLSIESNIKRKTYYSTANTIHTTVMMNDGEEEHDIITCRIYNDKIYKDLEQAKVNKVKILFTRLLSRSYTNYDGIGIIYLEATNLSQVIPNPNGSEVNQNLDTFTHDDNSFDETISRNDATSKQLLLPSATANIKKEILGKIMDIYIPSNNISLREHTNKIQLSSDTTILPSQILLLSPTNEQYRSTIITIQEENGNKAPSTIKINASSKIMQILCCNIQPTDILRESPSERKKKINVSKMIYHLLYGMIHEDIEFHWIIECGDNGLNCLDVHLLELHV